MENLLFLGVPILKHIRVIDNHWIELQIKEDFEDISEINFGIIHSCLTIFIWL